MSAIFHVGDCRVVLANVPDSSFDSIVTDPPYGISYMERGWDHGVPGVEYWREALRVTKPGGYLLAFGGTRMFHRLMCAIEDAGWEIRDTISDETCVLRWCYGVGFPKSMDASKAVDGEMFQRWLKANPDLAAQRKMRLAAANALPNKRELKKEIETEFRQRAGLERPVVGSKRGVAGENLNDITHDRSEVRTFADDGGRGMGAYGTGARQVATSVPITVAASEEAAEWEGWGTALKPAWEPIVVARRPLEGTVAENLLKHRAGAINIEGCRIEDPRDDEKRWPANLALVCACDGENHGEDCPVRELDAQSGSGFGNFGDASKYFYTAKASRTEREAGLHGRQAKIVNDGRKTDVDNPFQRGDTKRLNIHPTVKPLGLMRWLVRLSTRKGGKVLDLFCGSGTTGLACEYEGMDFVGIDLEEEHIDIARRRHAHAAVTAGTATIEHADTIGGGPVQLGLLSGVGS